MVSRLKRSLWHAFAGSSLLRRYFPRTVRDHIAQAIKDCERQHSGEIRVVIEGSLDHLPFQKCPTPRDRAIKVFAETGVWDTQANNGVLIYLLLADRAVEIIADRGINAKVPQEEWNKICKVIEQGFQLGSIEANMIAALNMIADLLKQHFPPTAGDVNELKDEVTVL